jgi:hypothetical protein
VSDGPMPSGPKRGKPASAVLAFAAACAALAADGQWVGTAHELLCSLARPAGERSWPRKTRTLNVWLWMARNDLAALGYGWERVSATVGAPRVRPDSWVFIISKGVDRWYRRGAGEAAQ